MTDKRTITNGNGKTIYMMIDPANTIQCSNTKVEWKLNKGQWYRIVAESDNSAWTNEDGLTVTFTCPPYASECKYPGRK